MGNSLQGLKQIAIDYLFDGMVLSEDIYNYDGKVLLLASGNTVTRHRIEQIKQHNANQRNISVFEETYQALLGHGSSLESSLAQVDLEEEAGYTDVKNQAAEMLSYIRENNMILEEKANQIGKNVSDMLRTKDLSIIFQCINGLNRMDEYLCRHSINVGLLNGLMGKWLGLSKEENELLILAGVVHDVGKTKIPAEILDAPRKLTLSEFTVMKQHTIFSYHLLNTENRFPECVKLAAKYHHEKMNGSGYPEGLIGDQIPLYAKITSVSDIYDAMISKRSYKEAYNPFAVISNLSKQQFSELDMRLVSLFTEYMPKELVGKSVLLSDGSIGVVKYIVPEDLEHPLVDLNGEIKKTCKDLYCVRIVLEE